MRGLRGQILTGRYHAPDIGDISATCQEVTIVGPGIPEIKEATADAPAVRVDQTTPGYMVLRPVGDPGPGRVGWMASGAYVVPDSLSRDGWMALFGHRLPIPLHDRSDVYTGY